MARFPFLGRLIIGVLRTVTNLSVRVTQTFFPTTTMSFASRSAQALRTAARRAPRTVLNVAAKSQVASYSLLARNTVAAASRAPAVQVRRVISSECFSLTKPSCDSAQLAA